MNRNLRDKVLIGVFAAIAALGSAVMVSCMQIPVQPDPYLPEVRTVCTGRTMRVWTEVRFSAEQLRRMANTPLDPALFTAFMEKQWSLNKIRAYCTPEHRCAGGQNLTGTKILSTNLHQSIQHEFDDILVYVCEDIGSNKNYVGETGRIWKRWTYSLNISRRNGHWRDYWRVIGSLPNDFMEGRESAIQDRPVGLEVHKPNLLEPEPDPTNQPVRVSSPSQLTALLEARWPVESIKLYCVPETRFNPSDYWDQLYWAYSATEIWEGYLHRGHESEIGQVWWFAVVKTGEVDTVSVNVIRGRDHWLLDLYGQQSSLLRKDEPRKVVERRISDSLKKSLDAYRWAEGPLNEAGEAAEEWVWQSYYYDASFLADAEYSYPANSIFPTQYVRYVDCEERHVVTVNLDDNAKPREFLVDGKRSRYLGRVYADFAANYSRWLDIFVYGNRMRPLSADMAWDAHLEALGFDPAEANRLTGVDGIHSNVLWESFVPTGSLQTLSCPDYAVWQSVSNGMTEAQVLGILGPPKVRNRRALDSGYEWQYGPVAAESGVSPEAKQFWIYFSLGHVGGKYDPLDGHSSTNGMPSTHERSP
jgi:hypothetical protein